MTFRSGWCDLGAQQWHQCAAYAVAADERDGVRGGLTSADRRAL